MAGLTLNVAGDDKVILHLRMMIEGVLALGKRLGVIDFQLKMTDVEFTPPTGGYASAPVQMPKNAKQVGLIQPGRPDFDTLPKPPAEKDEDDDIIEVETPVREGRQARMAMKYSEEIREQVRQLKAQGKSFSAISEALDISEQAVYRILKQSGMTQPAPPAVTDEQRKKIEELWKSKVTAGRIARQIGLSPDTVKRHLKKVGLYNSTGVYIDTPTLRVVK